MKDNQFSITLKGSFNDDEHIRLNEFTNQLEVINTVLRNIDSSINKTKSTYYRIINLSHSSPACVVFEAVPFPDTENNSQIIIHRFFEGLQNIIDGIIPEYYDYKIFESLKKFGSSNITEILLSYDNKNIDIPKNLSATINELLGPDEIIEDSITGMLEILDIHAREKKFYIYPIIGPKKVICKFSDDLLQQKAKEGIGHYIYVEGEFRYKKMSPFPYVVNVNDIEIYPDEDELPTLSALHGVAPNATGGISSEAFIRRIRNNEW